MNFACSSADSSDSSLCKFHSGVTEAAQSVRQHAFTWVVDDLAKVAQIDTFSQCLIPYQ